MSTSTPTSAPTALCYDGRSPELFLVFDRQVKRWLRRKFKGLTKYFWDGKFPTVTEENFADLCLAIYQSLLKTSPSYAVKVWKKREEDSVEKICHGNFLSKDALGSLPYGRYAPASLGAR